MEHLLHFKKILIRLCLATLLFISLRGSAQPDYAFGGATLISGTNLQNGATYRFNNVRPGIDAVLAITDITPGMGLTELDGTSGYTATLQPTITATPWTNGYIEMTITFKYGGTNTDMVQPQLAMTAIDVDGVTNFDGQGNHLHEFDQVDMGGGYADFNTMGGQLSISQSGNWFTGTNVAGVDYPGRDTSAQQVMFSVINANVTTFVLRVGVNNQTAASASRLRSVYFKKFNYNNSILALREDVRQKKQKASGMNDPEILSIHPSVIRSNASISLQSEKDGWASLELIDYSGRQMMKQQLVVNKGVNKIPFFNSSGISSGNYIALLRMDGKVYHYKLIKQ